MTAHPVAGARARPFVKWAGGKRTVVPEIIERLPEKINGTYWEPFVGGGAVFFALDGIITSAQLSDVNCELTSAYQVVKDQPETLIDLLENHATNHSKAYYLEVRSAGVPPAMVDAAARFIYLNKTCFNGLYRVNKDGLFNVPIGGYKAPTICDAFAIRDASEALHKATICNIDFEEIGPEVGDFVYADPPYDGAFTGYNSKGFDKTDQSRLRDAALHWHNQGAKVMLSNADTQLIRRLYGQPPFRLHEITAPRIINCDGQGRGAVSDLLITTYDPPEERNILC